MLLRLVQMSQLEGNDKDKMLAFKFGGQWRFDAKEIEEWRKNQGKKIRKSYKKLLER